MTDLRCSVCDHAKFVHDAMPTDHEFTPVATEPELVISITRTAGGDQELIYVQFDGDEIEFTLTAGKAEELIDGLIEALAQMEHQHAAAVPDHVVLDADRLRRAIAEYPTERGGRE